MMSRRTLLSNPHHKHLWGPGPAGRRASGACRRALPAKAAGNGNGGPRRLEGVHCWSFRESKSVFLLCCSALLYCHAFCAALPPAASAAPCVELCKRHHCTLVFRHRGPAQKWQICGTCLPTDTPAGTVQQRCSCTPDVDAHIYVSQLRFAFPTVHLSANVPHRLCQSTCQCMRRGQRAEGFPCGPKQVHRGSPAGAVQGSRRPARARH